MFLILTLQLALGAYPGLRASWADLLLLIGKRRFTDSHFATNLGDFLSTLCLFRRINYL